MQLLFYSPDWTWINRIILPRVVKFHLIVHRSSGNLKSPFQRRHLRSPFQRRLLRFFCPPERSPLKWHLVDWSHSLGSCTFDSHFSGVVWLVVGSRSRKIHRLFITIGFSCKALVNWQFPRILLMANLRCFGLLVPIAVFLSYLSQSLAELLIAHHFRSKK